VLDFSGEVLGLLVC